MKFLNSFDDLIVERNIQLLLEGRLIGSDQFLSRIKNTSNTKVGEFLIDQFSSNDDRGDLAQNIIDVTNKEDSITFMSDKSFAKIGRDESDPEIFKLKGRSETRIGRFVRSLCAKLGQNFTDKEIEEFVNSYKASDATKDNFKLVSGNNIGKYYHEDTYSSVSGNLGDSCMRYPECQDYFDIYNKNPDTCRMLVLFDAKNKVLGRALIWKIHRKELNEECTAEYFMDRIYTKNDSDAVKFRKFAETNNWLCRKRNNNDSDFNSMVFIYKGKTIWGKLTSELRPGIRISEFPYVDSMCFLKGRYISNAGLGQDQKILCSTDGSYDSCHTCGNTGKETIYECPDCDGTGQIICPKCKCVKCNGNGRIDCPKCDEGITKCVDCEGDGNIRCSHCDDGYNTCNKCGGNGEFKCKKCKGNGDLGFCKKCKGQDMICKICDGKGQYHKKWGMGKRLIKCTECENGIIKRNSYFTSKEGSLNRCDCYHGRLWQGTMDQGYNSGIEVCTDCGGEGSIMCDPCDGDGKIICQNCDGNGDIPCETCGGDGGWKCKNCGGDGWWECKDCGGDGRTNKKCECHEGYINCPSCKGSGTPKNNKKNCKDCVGLTDRLNKEIKDGKFKP